MTEQTTDGADNTDNADKNDNAAGTDSAVGAHNTDGTEGTEGAAGPSEPNPFDYPRGWAADVGPSDGGSVHLRPTVHTRADRLVERPHRSSARAPSRAHL